MPETAPLSQYQGPTASTSPIQLGRARPLTQVSVSLESTKDHQGRYTHPDTLSDTSPSPWAGLPAATSGQHNLASEPVHRQSASVSSAVSITDLASSGARDYPPDSSRITRRLVADSDPVHLPAARSSSRGREPAVARILAEHPGPWSSQSSLATSSSQGREHSPSWDNSADAHRARSFSTPRTSSPGFVPPGSIPIGSASLVRTYSDANSTYSSHSPQHQPSYIGQSAVGVRDSESNFSGPKSYESRGSHGSASTNWSERFRERDLGGAAEVQSHFDEGSRRWNGSIRQSSSPATGETWSRLAWEEQEGRSRTENQEEDRYLPAKRSQSVNAATERADNQDNAFASPRSESAGRFRRSAQDSPRIAANSSSPRNLPSMPEEHFTSRGALSHESEHDADGNGGTATARGSPQRGPTTLAPGRPSRSRSNSSAAVLALHGLTTRSIEQQQQRQAAAHSREEAFAPWGVDPRPSFSGRVGLHSEELPEGRYGGVVSPHRLAPLSGRGGSEMEARDDIFPSRAMHDGLQASFLDRSSYTNVNPYTREGNPQFLDGIEDLKRHQPQYSAHTDFYGSESRRHSIATTAAVDRYEPNHYQAKVENGRTQFGQRRAVGFEVHNGGPEQSHWPAEAKHLDQRGSRSMFSGGALAFSDDDLTSLSLGLDHDREPGQHEENARGRMNVRVPSSAAAATGLHSSSMPPMFGGRQHDTVNASPPTHNPQAFRGRTLTSGGGEHRSAASSWDPYHSSGLSPSRNDLDHTARKFRAISIGVAADAQRRDYVNGSFSGTPPRLAESGFNALPTDRVDSDRRHSGRQPLNALQQGDSPGSGAFGKAASHIASFGHQQSGQYLADQHAHTIQTMPPGGLDSRPGQIHLSSVGNVDLTDYAIASLATLGPMAPVGGHGGMAHSGNDLHNAPALLHDMGKGVPLATLARETQLYIVEFKQGRTDLYFRETPARSGEAPISKGDLAIVEADRGKDLGTVVNDSISVAQVQMFLAHQAELVSGAITPQDASAQGPGGSTVSRLTRTINPKRLYGRASPADLSLLYSKAQDEERALQLCIAKVNQRGLAMTVVAAEMQWDRRKLTFYYTASMRVDFRALVQEMFRLFKTRIWMCHLSHPFAGR